jgi:hypothetical protein
MCKQVYKIDYIQSLTIYKLIKPLKHGRRVRNFSRSKQKLWDRSEKQLFLEEEGPPFFSEVSQALPARPSDKDGMREKASGR